MRAQNISLSVLAFATAFLPVIVSAQQRVQGILLIFNDIFNLVIGLFVTVAIVVFFWGLIQYLAKGGDEMAKTGINLMFWSIVALFVMVSVWGLVRLLQNTFGVSNTPVTIPSGPLPGQRVTQ